MGDQFYHQTPIQVEYLFSMAAIMEMEPLILTSTQT